MQEMLHAALRDGMAPVQPAQLCLGHKGEGSRLCWQHHGQQTEDKILMSGWCQASVDGGEKVSFKWVPLHGCVGGFCS